MTKPIVRTNTAQWRLLLKNDTDTPEPFQITRNTITLGRANDNDISLEDKTVSQYHARLTQQRSQLIIEDLHSNTGTMINGEPLRAPYALQSDDQIGIGNFTLTVEQNISKSSPPIRAFASPSTFATGKLGVGVLLVSFVMMMLGCTFFSMTLMLSLMPSQSAISSWPTVALVPVATRPIAPLSSPTSTVSLAEPTATLAMLGGESDEADQAESAGNMPTSTNTPIFLEGPQLTVNQAPSTGALVPLNQPVTVDITGRDEQGVLRLELWANGEKVSEEALSADQLSTTLSAMLSWQPTTAGAYQLEVRAIGRGGLSTSQPITTLWAGATPTPPPPPTPVPQPVTGQPMLLVEVPILNVRNGPATRYRIIGELKRGDQTKIVGETENSLGKWWQVRLNGTLGWVSGSPNYVTVFNPAKPTAVPPTHTPTRPKITSVNTPVLIASSTPFATATPVPTQEPVAEQNFLHPPTGKTLLIISNRSRDNHETVLTISGGKSVGGGKEFRASGAQNELQFVLEPDHYRAMWSSPPIDFVRAFEFDAMPNKIMVMWAIPEDNNIETELYDQLLIGSAPSTATPIPQPTTTSDMTYIAPPGKALFIAENRSGANEFSSMTITGGNFGGGKEFILDAGTETPLELLPNDYRVLWTSPARPGGFSAGREFSVIAGEVILSWIVPENGVVFMQFPGQEPEQVNH
ncbi:FHA domain-containing protein [Anaerolineales bacterium HSG6]|nr:FHA domain-containing protein [Anaerolineales bacterium HSG6]